MNNRENALRLAPLKPFPCVFGKDPAPGFLWTAWPHEDGYADNLAAVWDYYHDKHGIDPAPAFQPGAHGLIGLDLDRKPGKPDGVALFDSLLDQYGDLPPCPMTATPSGGYHVIMRQPAGRQPLGNRAGWFKGNGVDVRGRNGYLLCPGAVLGDTGEVYESAPGCPDLVDAFLADAIPEIPQWIVDLIEGEPEPTRTNLGSPSGGVTPAVTPGAGAYSPRRATAYIESALNGWMNKLAVAIETTRNNTLNDAVFYIRGLMVCPTLAASTLTERQVWDAMWFACDRNGYLRSKKDGPRAFAATFRSAWNAGTAEPARGPAPDPMVPEDFCVNLVK
jgi:hypothetical protein